MICAVFGENRVTLRGHARYAPPGEDIVCAAASALVFALIGALEEKAAAVCTAGGTGSGRGKRGRYGSRRRGAAGGL